MTDTLIAVCLGIGLAAACGFRIFVPMLVIAIVAKAQWLTLADGFEWVGSWPAIIAFAVATVLEIAAYYVPWLDNALDTVATPTAAVAGVVVAAACIVEMDPLLKWSLAVIAGGGVAASVKTGLAGLRLGTTAATTGAGNPVLSTIEWISSLAMSVLSIVLPILAAIIAIVLAIVLLRWAFRLCQFLFARPAAKAASEAKGDASGRPE